MDWGGDRKESNGVSKCDERNVVEVSHANKKGNYITTDELRKGVSRETVENEIVSDNIESLPNSAPGDMGWLMDTYIKMVDMLSLVLPELNEMKKM